MRTFKWISVTLFLCAILLATLFFTTDLPNDSKNGFVRNWMSKEISSFKERKIDAPLTKIIGATSTSIFASFSDPRAVLILDKELRTKDTLGINFGVPQKKLIPNTIVLDSPMLYLHLNNLSTVIFGDFSTRKLKATQIKPGIFTKSLQISDSSMVVRSVALSLDKQVFQKVNCNSGEVMKELDLFKNQTDAGISTDGTLLYDKNSHQLFYIQFLTNNFYCLDTNLNLIYQSKTIDTTNFSTVKIGFEQSGSEQGKLVSSEARVVVNISAFIAKGRLFVISGLKADNESLSEFQRNSVVDVYNTSTGAYRGSFYIRKVDRHALKSAMIIDDCIVALYDKQMVMYKLPAAIF